MAIVSMKQLIASLDADTKSNCERIIRDIEGMAMLFDVEPGQVFIALETIGQEVLDNVETQRQLGKTVLDRLERMDEVDEERAEATRRAMTIAGDGGQTPYLKDFHVLAGLVQTQLVLNRVSKQD